MINVSDREVVNYKNNQKFIKNYRFYAMSDTASAKFDGIIEEAVRIIHDSRSKEGRIHFIFKCIFPQIPEGVLVHCFLGVSRSATLVAFYLISALSINWRDAVDFIHHRRFSANPNFGFLHQLKVYSTTVGKIE